MSEELENKWQLWIMIIGFREDGSPICTVPAPLEKLEEYAIKEGLHGPVFLCNLVYSHDIQVEVRLNREKSRVIDHEAEYESKLDDSNSGSSSDMGITWPGGSPVTDSGEPIFESQNSTM